MTDASDRTKTTGRLRWVEHTPTFKSLWFGRVLLAQIEQGRASPDWFWTLRFCEKGEKPAFSAPTERQAKAVCMRHARKVLA